MSAPRSAPLEVKPAEFRVLGHALIEQIADYLEGLPERSIVAATVQDVRARVQAIGWHAEGEPLAEIVASAASLLLEHSVITSHPRFWGYINGAASPVAALADLVATTANPNASAWYVGPATSAMEEQTIGWLAELVGYPRDAGGQLTSGGSMANLIGLAAARHALGAAPGGLRVYATRETHTWLAKAASFLGLGPTAIRWIATEPGGRMSLAALRAALDEDDRAAGPAPSVVVANAGTTSTGAIDPIEEIAALCDARGAWLHVDGAYGAPAACVASAPRDLHVLARASSLVLDPHKWLYTSIEAGCVLVRDRRVLTDAFAHGSPYYGVGIDELPHLRDLGPQTTRGARVVKVWMCLRRAGRAGYASMIGDDIALARRLFDLASAHPELEAITHNLSITTFRYVPATAAHDPGALDEINREIVRRLQAGGRVYPSQTTVDGRVAIRVCIVNFRTTAADIDLLPTLVVDAGRAIAQGH